MKEHKIVIEIDDDGKLTADADGFSGDACLKDVERLLEGLAGSWSVTRKTDADDRRIKTVSRQSVGKKK